MLSMRTPRPRGAQSCVFTTGAKLFADGTAWIEYGGRLLTNHNSGLGCAAYYGSCVTLMFRLELQPSSQKAMSKLPAVMLCNACMATVCKGGAW